LSSATFLLTDLNLVLLPTIALYFALWSGICWMQLMYEKVHRCTCHGWNSAPTKFTVLLVPLFFFLEKF
jgi:hypothetical protein